MPMYEYHCEKCGEEFEELVGVGATASPKCPSCGSERTQKKVSTFASMGSSGTGGSCAGSRFT